MMQPRAGAWPTAWLIHRGWIVATGICLLGAADASYGQNSCGSTRVVADDGTPFDSFGSAVGISGGTALVGADFEGAGSAYVFRYDPNTLGWPQAQKLLASDGQGGDEFGSAVAIDGDIAMISALQHVHGNANGSVYVFWFDGTSWSEVQELLASDGALGDGFGWSVSIRGDRAVIGAARDDDNGTSSGSAYVFRSTPRWVEEQKLLASDGNAGDNFGLSVAIDGDLVVIGSPGTDEVCPGMPSCDSGAAYIFRFDSASSTWVEEQKLLASDAASNDALGRSVSVSGAVAVIGAPFGNNGTGIGTNTGSAYVFRYDPSTSLWIQEQELLASDGNDGDRFGRAVAIDGDTAVIGAWLNDDVGQSFGAAYIFRFDGASWIQQQKLLPDAGLWTAFFGFSVALSGDNAVIGAYGENQQAGAAYIFPAACPCPWDCEGVPDNIVGITDLFELFGQWTMVGTSCDFDGGSVGITDLFEMFGNWGPCP